MDPEIIKALKLAAIEDDTSASEALEGGRCAMARAAEEEMIVPNVFISLKRTH